MKIGLVLAYKGTNYGMHLQGYAIQQILEGLGHETTIIEYKHDKFNLVSFDLGLFPYLYNRLVDKLHRKKVQSDFSEIHIRNNILRKQVSDEFRSTMLHNIKPIYGYKALCEFGKSCDCVLIGSDQMWLPGVSLGNFLSLKFVADTATKISYATSLGVSEYPKYLYHSARKMWNRIDFLSTREEEGKRVINAVCPSKEVKVVADPTYLLTKEEWLEKIPQQRILNNKYVLCYFLGNNVGSLECARRYADSKGLQTVSILSNESTCKIDTTFCDKLIIGADVAKFVNLIRGAECIFTDSFHGVAFSVINEKNFYIFYRKRDDAKLSRNSRIDNILRTWNLTNRLITDNLIDWENVEDIDIDYAEVGKTLSRYRLESFNWLKSALKHGKK